MLCIKIKVSVNVYIKKAQIENDFEDALIMQHLDITHYR